MQGPPCPTQGCLYEHHLHSRASLAPTETQSCVTLTNRTGFLCHDRRHCIPAHGVCDGVRTCPHGEDEDESLCREYPSVLFPVHPPTAAFLCSQPCGAFSGPTSASLSPGLDRTSCCILRDPSLFLPPQHLQPSFKAEFTSCLFPGAFPESCWGSQQLFF